MGYGKSVNPNFVYFRTVMINSKSKFRVGEGDRRRMETEAKTKVVASVWGQN